MVIFKENHPELVAMSIINSESEFAHQFSEDYIKPKFKNMLTVVYCTKETKPKHREHLIKSSGLHKHIEVIEIINNGESLTKAYNRGLKQAKNDVVVFCHDDLTIETKQWGKKLLKHYDKNPDFSILGVAGTTNITESGRWWDHTKSMRGRVKHTHEGKSWLNKYSSDQGTDISEVVLVDGVFFSVKKSLLKEEFDETVEGFHFYDVDFCFKNHLSGGKIGVHTNIVINHQSIGETNEAWEDNRKLFVEKYSASLPIKLPETFQFRKLKVLLGCLSFKNLTGSEMYVYELAKELTNQGCEVSICSNLGAPLTNLVKDIKLYQIKEPPHYKLGDGRWALKTPNGDIPSQRGKLYQISPVDFDVIHSMHKPITERLLDLYPETPFISTIHSEIIELEEPVISDTIKKYVAIRPEIKEHLIDNFKIDESKIDVIYNPFDSKRFNTNYDVVENERKRVLFVGTIDYLRKNTILDLIKTTAEESKDLWIIGRENGVTIKDLIEGYDHVTYLGEKKRPEDFIKQCDETAGILLGRTTIEGWLCGKPGVIYNVDDKGDILGKEFQQVPDDLEKFKASNSVSLVKDAYLNIINHV